MALGSSLINSLYESVSLIFSWAIKIMGLFILRVYDFSYQVKILVFNSVPMRSTKK